MSLISPELSNKVEMWRQKSSTNTLSIDEMREAIAALRQGRCTATVESTTTKRTKAAKAPARNADDMLGELEGL